MTRLQRLDQLRKAQQAPDLGAVDEPHPRSPSLSPVIPGALQREAVQCRPGTHRPALPDRWVPALAALDRDDIYSGAN